MPINLCLIFREISVLRTHRTREGENESIMYIIHFLGNKQNGTSGRILGGKIKQLGFLTCFRVKSADLRHIFTVSTILMVAGGWACETSR